MLSKFYWGSLAADFFYSMLNLRLPVALAMMAAAYLLSFLLWALIWHGVYWRGPAPGRFKLATVRLGLCHVPGFGLHQ